MVDEDNSGVVEGAGGLGKVHKIYVMFSLGSRNVGVVDFDRGVDRGKEGTKRRKPSGVAAGSRSCGFGEKGETDAGMILKPRDGDAKSGTDLTLGPPIFEKIRDLAFALNPFPADKAAAEIILGTVEERAFGIAVVATFGKDRRHRFIFGVIKLCGKEEASGKDVDGGEVDGVVICSGLCGRGGAANEELGDGLLGVGGFCKLKYVFAGWGFEMSECLVWVEDGLGGDIN
jgi:hypothetical protein